MSVMDLYYAEIYIGTVVTLIVTLAYGVLAPWYKYSSGRYIFGLFAALSAVLVNASIRITFKENPITLHIAAFIFTMYIIAMIAMAIAIYNAQIRRWLKDKEKEQAESEEMV